MLKRRWKNLRDGMMRCLKKISEGQKSGAGASKVPTCKFFNQLLFLRDFVSNRETNSNITLPIESEVDDIISCEKSPEQHQVCSDTARLKEKTPTREKSSAKRKLALTDENKPFGRLNKRADRQEKIDLLLVNPLSKSEDQQKENSELRSSNQLFCDSIVEILDKLPSKKNRWQELKYSRF